MDQNMSMMLGPWGLIIGCGLMTVSGLSLIGIHFFKTRLQAIAAFCAGLVLLGAVELSFMADSGAYFFQKQKIEVAECYAEGEGAFPAAKATKDNEAGLYIGECISKIGYEWIPDHHKCQEYLMPMNAYCYLPTGSISRAVTRIQTSFE